MILNCNSCGKKFVVPDNAISASGRLVQCSSCGNKWKQFPVKAETSKIPLKRVKVPVVKKETSIKAATTQIKKNKIKKVTKKAGPSLYSPEYLAKKHGIKLNEKKIDQKKPISSEKQISFGFYNYLIVFVIILIFSLRILYFAETEIVKIIPNAEIYLTYLFETIRNLADIIFDFITIY